MDEARLMQVSADGMVRSKGPRDLNHCTTALEHNIATPMAHKIDGNPDVILRAIQPNIDHYKTPPCLSVPARFAFAGKHGVTT